MVEYGIYEKALISSDLENSLRYAHSHGYTFWEISIDSDRKSRLDWSEKEIEDLLNICLKTNMPIFNMVLSIHREFPLGSNNSEIRTQGLKYLYKAIDLSVKLGIRTIQLAGYYNSSNALSDGDCEYFINSLRKGAQYAESKGVMLGIENMDYDLVSTKEIKYIIETINSPYLNYFLDVGNFIANGLDPLDELKDIIPRLVGLHLKETRKKTYRRVDFGTGSVPFEKIFVFLNQNNYNGYLGIEMWNDDNPDSLHKIDHARTWLENKRIN